MKFPEKVINSLVNRSKKGKEMIKVKLIHHYRDLVDAWDESPFKDVEESQVDIPNHTIRNVCVFGTRHSKNGYTYEDPAIDRLVQLAEGAKFFVNHPSKSETKERDGVRDIRDWAGVYASPRKEGADKVYADLRVRPTWWDLVYDVATLKPPGVGNSINSRVKIFKDQAGKEHVVDIDVLKSIDLVASAATTSNLFESQEDKMMIEKDEVIDQILSEQDGKAQGDMAYQLVRDVSEGLLADKLKEREIARKVSDLQWKAGDTIEEALRNKDKDMKIKKEEIAAILNDLESMINDILAGKKVANTETNKEEDEMDFTKLTLEDLGKERPDLVQAIQDSLKVTEKVTTLEAENTDLKSKLDAITAERNDLKTKLEAITAERDELKVKVDEYGTKEKGAKKEAFIDAQIAELKVPKDIVTDVFKSNLMAMKDEEITEALKDRKEIFLKGQKVIRNAGEEYVPKLEQHDDGDTKAKAEAASNKLKEAKGK